MTRERVLMKEPEACKFKSNNTPQAYSAVYCSDAQTGGLLIWSAGKTNSGVLTYDPLLTSIIHNTPAMPLIDAHFGGFFVFGVRK